MTWLLAAGFAALVLAAGVDALRSSGGGASPRPPEELPAETTTGEEAAAVEEPEETPRTARDVAAAGLRRAGVHGVLTYADPDCRIHVVRLPDLVEREAPDASTCSFAPQRLREMTFDGTAVSPDGTLGARCEGSAVRVSRRGERESATYRGCMPAWRADGALAVVRGGEVVVLQGRLGDGGPVGERPALTRAALATALERSGWRGYEFAVEEIAWLAWDRIAAIVRARSRDERLDLLAVFDGDGTLVGQPGFGYGDLAHVRASPSGRFAVARIVDPGGLAVLDLEGRTVRPAVRHGYALAWSPDERWIATAASDGIYVFRADERTPSIHHVPIDARDVHWR
ncbi:MAG TPA: hypothetical protein VK915_08770 [Gaiellaceae bacterium]|nr:hypothetical protein [Gaiellaceae bacterium]